MGVDYDTDDEFPPDDTGHGFDNIGDVLTVSPLLLEKYIHAAKSIVSQAVPTVVEGRGRDGLPGRRFQPAPGPQGRRARRTSEGAGHALSLSYYEPATVSTAFQAEHAGRYQLVLDLIGDGAVRRRRLRLQQVPPDLQGRRPGAAPAGIRPAGGQGLPLRVRPRLEGRPPRADASSCSR